MRGTAEMVPVLALWIENADWSDNADEGMTLQVHPDDSKGMHGRKRSRDWSLHWRASSTPFMPRNAKR